jgi:hypothetical protein
MTSTALMIKWYKPNCIFNIIQSRCGCYAMVQKCAVFHTMIFIFSPFGILVL